MKSFRPQVEITDKLAIFRFTLLGTNLTSKQVLEFLEATAEKAGDLWAYRMEDSHIGMVEILRPNGEKQILYADPFEILSPELTPNRLLSWMPPSVIRGVLGSGLDVPVKIGDTNTTYTTLISK